MLMPQRFFKLDNLVLLFPKYPCPPPQHPSLSLSAFCWSFPSPSSPLTHDTPYIPTNSTNTCVFSTSCYHVYGPPQSAFLPPPSLPVVLQGPGQIPSSQWKHLLVIAVPPTPSLYQQNSSCAFIISSNTSCLVWEVAVRKSVSLPDCEVFVGKIQQTADDLHLPYTRQRARPGGWK